ncbi:MAG: hypothetical protein IPJ88_03425 [Myxococcales bacterium]|nr:MAG: hypothetical protein IPJ88_03425 [Myxococcales bacterium]
MFLRSPIRVCIAGFIVSVVLTNLSACAAESELSDQAVHGGSDAMIRPIYNPLSDVSRCDAVIQALTDGTIEDNELSDSEIEVLLSESSSGLTVGQELCDTIASSASTLFFATAVPTPIGGGALSALRTLVLGALALTALSVSVIIITRVLQHLAFNSDIEGAAQSARAEYSAALSEAVGASAITAEQQRQLDRLLGDAILNYYNTSSARERARRAKDRHCIALAIGSNRIATVTWGIGANVCEIPARFGSSGYQDTECRSARAMAADQLAEQDATLVAGAHFNGCATPKEVRYFDAQSFNN